MISVFPTSYFGNMSYYSSILKYDKIVLEAKENFIKQTFRNRCEILTANGVQQLSIPVIRKNGSKTSIDEVEISYDTDWRKDHWKAIESAYSNSPYFDHYGTEVKELIYFNESNLLRFNENIHNRICNWLGIDIPFSYSSEYLAINSSNRYNFEIYPNLNKYIQVFGNRSSFEPNISIIDAVFCLGPIARVQIINN
jgi:hypothetical protein